MTFAQIEALAKGFVAVERDEARRMIAIAQLAAGGTADQIDAFCATPADTVAAAASDEDDITAQLAALGLKETE